MNKLRQIITYKLWGTVACYLFYIPLLSAQQQKVDTTHIYSIPEVIVADRYQTREIRSTAPIQVF